MKKDLLKRIVSITCSSLLLLGAGAASAQTSSSSQSSTQSLGDAARAARKNKPQSDSAPRVYDNDNLPTTETLSVVGPEPSAQPSASQQAQSFAATEAAAAEQRQKSADEVQVKLDAQKAKIDQIAHELDLDQREYRLKSAALYNDAGNRLRNAGEFDKEGAQYRADMEAKQKALDEAKAQLSDLQEEARKAGLREKDSTGTPRDAVKDTSDDKGNDKDKDKDKDK